METAGPGVATCHVSRVTCYMSCVMCHVSRVTCHEADVQVDVDHDGTLNFEEFSNLTASIRHKKDPCGDLKMCWRVLGSFIIYFSLLYLLTLYFMLLQIHLVKERYQ